VKRIGERILRSEELIERSKERIERSEERIKRSEERIERSEERIELTRKGIIPMELIKRSIERITFKFIMEHTLMKDIKS
jgi:hypothetical protein